MSCLHQDINFPIIINKILSGLAQAVWLPYLGLTNLIGFNRFCAMYFSVGRYEKMFSESNVNKILIGLVICQMMVFVMSQTPDLSLAFTLKTYHFYYTGSKDSRMLKIFTICNISWMLVNMFMTAVWYVLVYLKVKKQVNFVF